MAETPIFKNLQQCREKNPTKNPLLHDIFAQKNLQKWPIKVNFQGWRKPHQNWTDWVEKVSLNYAKCWESTGICDGILSSLHEIKHNPEIVLALSEFWCAETNTFMFPWGETTITLEDVSVLFGLPVLGETANLSVTEVSSLNLERKLVQVKNAMSISACETDAWIKYFDQENGEFEHVGFLAFWLSMFVFPDVSDRTVGSHVFSAAVRLAKGVKVALAPAVLACLYENLTFVTRNAADFDSAKKEVCVPGPFQLVLVWALERFPWLGSKVAKPLGLGWPRIARWDNVCVKTGLVDVRKGLISSGDSFCWRPYAMELENWRVKSYYLDFEKKLAECSGEVDDELESFRVCMQPRELVGIDFAATYRPQRVMKQFGCEQKVCAEAVPSSPLESGNVRLIKDEESLVPSHNQMSNESNNGIARHDDQKKPLLTSNTVKAELITDESGASAVSEVLNVSGNDSGTKQTFPVDEEEQSWDDVVIVDSNDEVAAESECKDVIQSRSSTKRPRKRIGDSPDCPLYIFECSQKAVKKSGLSPASAIDVEDY